MQPPARPLFQAQTLQEGHVDLFERVDPCQQRLGCLARFGQFTRPGVLIEAGDRAFRIGNNGPVAIAVDDLCLHQVRQDFVDRPFSGRRSPIQRRIIQAGQDRAQARGELALRCEGISLAQERNLVAQHGRAVRQVDFAIAGVQHDCRWLCSRFLLVAGRNTDGWLDRLRVLIAHEDHAPERFGQRQSALLPGFFRP